MHENRKYLAGEALVYLSNSLRRTNKMSPPQEEPNVRAKGNSCKPIKKDNARNKRFSDLQEAYREQGTRELWAPRLADSFQKNEQEGLFVYFVYMYYKAEGIPWLAEPRQKEKCRSQLTSCTLRITPP